MNNIPKVALGLVSVSRDCFPISLSAARKKAVAASCKAANVAIYEAEAIVENEKDAMRALEEVQKAGVNALVIYLGNFGPEGPETILAQKFGGPVMFVAAAEESQNTMFDGRGDAYCGMLNASYSLNLRGLRAYIPEYPVGTPDEVAKMIAEFEDIARVVLGVKGLKIFSFGPRPYDFLACNAPIAPLYQLGVEIQENSELDLFASYHEHANDARIEGIVQEMKAELGDGNRYEGILPRLAQYEITLLDWYENNIGASKYAVFANKCWPAFQTQFGFVPCYVNGRLAARGIPVACETDIYGGLSEFILTCATQKAATLLDINNSVPKDLFEANPKEFEGATLSDTFMGFHCGNASKECLGCSCMSYQRIMKRSLEPDGEPDITRGTLEGNLRPGAATIFRLQSTADTKLRSYVAEGKIADVDCKSFGAIGTFVIPEMGRFYRHVLIAKCYPHHAGIGFAHAGKTLFAAMKLLGVEDVAFNQPKHMMYKDENPFA